ncbi:MAG: AAA family ATPase [Bacteroidetes bacterium]|nr:AAA family ATPase [Bacteroidota bacterium]HET6244214.1 AAA family ATPase [Bacteroidia bacterium]
MIKKFIKIHGTGKFLNYNHSTIPSGHRTTDFERINLIYGENGSGKTTIAVILNSLKGDNTLLPKKRAFDRTVTQTVEVLTDDTTNPKLTFTSTAWDNHYENIEIFDIHFINENIYTGLEIQTSHKKNLFEVIFGQQGIALKLDIQSIKDRIHNGGKIIKETTEKIELAIERAYTAEAFTNIQIDTDVDNKISLKEAEILTAKSFQTIQSKANLNLIQVLTFPFDTVALETALSQSIDTISETYLAKFNEHKDHLVMGGKSEQWIKQGYEAIKNNGCPFCLRPFEDTIEIIEAYKQYFNEEYNSLLEQLGEQRLAISNFNLEAQFLEIENKITANINLIEFWQPHIQNPPVLVSVIQEKESFVSAFEAIKEVLKLKSENPIKSHDPSSVSHFNTIVEAFNKKITELNVHISAYKASIAATKALIQPNLVQLEIDLRKLKAIKKRSDPTIDGFCTNLTSYNSSVALLKTDKDAKQLLLDNYSTTIFANYSTKINQYLQAFAPYLEIRGLDSVYVGSSKEPMIKYALHINGNEIKLEDSPLFSTFKYSLSEGDKSALALAFFLTKLEVDGNIQDKIIVFDDPVSSFDLNRKSTTISKLLHFAQQAKQLFVLTHNIIFAGEFWKSTNQINLTNQCSKIEFVGNTGCIVEYHIDNDTLSSVLKDSTAIKNYLTNGCFIDQERRNIARCLRPALESYFHLKFFDLLLPSEWLGNFIDKVRNSITTDAYNRLLPEVAELTDINDYSKKYHHRHNTNSDSEPVTDAELRNYCERTLKLIQLI